MVPIEGHVVADEGAHGVVAPPYDALTAAQRRALAAADPNSFLNVLPPEGPEATADLEHTLRACRRSLDRLLTEGLYVPFPGPVLAVVALGSGEDRTVAIVGDLPVTAFSDGSVLPHERTRDDRVHQLRRYLEVVGVASSPVAVTHRPHPAVTETTAPVLLRDPVVAYRGEDGIDVALWVVTDVDEQARLAQALERAGTLYIADGHHRAAAAHEFADANDADGSVPAGRVLTAAIPADQLHVQPFHRRIREVPHLDVDEVVRRLRGAGLAPAALDGPGAPTMAGTVTLTVDGRWFRIDLRARRVEDAVEGLDVRLVERELLPLLLEDTGRDSARVQPVAGPSGLAELQQPDTVGIALAPPDVEAILEVSDLGRSMPAKTTFVAPKLRSGLLVVPRGVGPSRS
jgi:uncharacterized protein (DUF1015 family)